MKKEIKRELELVHKYLDAINEVRPEHEEDHKNIKIHLLRIEDILKDCDMETKKDSETEGEKKAFYPELTQEGKQQAQDLMNKFEKKLKESATEIMSNISSDFYCNILHEIESDHWTNYRTKIINAICDYSSNKNKNGGYEFDQIRRAIYKHHKEEIVKDLNQDLLCEIEDLKRELTRSYG